MGKIETDRSKGKKFNKHFEIERLMELE